MLIKVNVTQEHINRGIRFKPCLCPVALAIKSAMQQSVVVGIYEAVVGTTNVYLPIEVTRFINEFDLDLPTNVQPFSFNLEIPDEVKPDAN